MRRLKRLVQVLAIALVCIPAAGGAGELGEAVIKRLGRVVPTPVPTPRSEEKIRLISSLTVQNKPNGNSTLTFEAADFGESAGGQYRVIAIEQYSLIEPKAEGRQLRDEIVRKLRDIERDLLRYVEIVGPPKPPQKIFEAGAGSQPLR